MSSQVPTKRGPQVQVQFLVLSKGSQPRYQPSTRKKTGPVESEYISGGTLHLLPSVKIGAESALQLAYFITTFYFATESPLSGPIGSGKIEAQIHIALQPGPKACFDLSQPHDRGLVQSISGALPDNLHCLRPSRRGK